MSQHIFDQLDQLQRGARETRLRERAFDGGLAQCGSYDHDPTARDWDMGHGNDGTYLQGLHRNRNHEVSFEEYYDSPSAVDISDQAVHYDRRTYVEPRMPPAEPDYFQHQSRRPQVDEPPLGSHFDLCKPVSCCRFAKLC